MLNIQKFWTDLFEFNCAFTMDQKILIETIDEEGEKEFLVPPEYIKDIPSFEAMFKNTDMDEFTVRFKDIKVWFSYNDFLKDEDQDYVNLSINSVYGLEV